MITCRELIDFLDDYVSGNIEPARREEFERHLSVCPECVNYVQSYRATISISKAAHSDDCAGASDKPPADVPQKLIKAILSQREPRR